MGTRTHAHPSAAGGWRRDEVDGGDRSTANGKRRLGQRRLFRWLVIADDIGCFWFCPAWSLHSRGVYASRRRGTPARSWVLFGVALGGARYASQVTSLRGV